MKNPPVRFPELFSVPGPAAQAVWSGTLGFSLVAIPVRLVKAVEPGRVSFRLLHRKDYAPLLRRMICPEEQKEVPPEEIVRGAEVAPDRYVLITDEELESLAPERSRTIDLIAFVEQPELDPVYFRHPYYLLPDKGGEKAYSLLVEALERTGKTGLARFVLGERELFAAIESRGGALLLITLHYQSELLSREEVAPEEEAVAPKAKAQVVAVIRERSADFDPEKYADERRQRLVQLLKKKLKAQRLVQAPALEAEAGEGPVDLVAALEESMRQAKQRAGRGHP